MKYAGVLLLAASVLAGCSKSETNSPSSESSVSDKVSESQESSSSSNSSSSSSSDESESDDSIDIENTKVINTGTTDLSSIDQPVEIISGGTYILSGSSEHMVVINAKGQNVHLILDGVSITNDSGPSIYVRKAELVTIEASGNNTLYSGGTLAYDALNAGIYSKADLVLQGSGTVNVTAEGGHGIKAKDTLQIKTGTWNIEALDDGIHINEDCTIDEGTISIKAYNDEGIQSEQALTINGGNITIQSTGDALRAETDLTVMDGTFNLKTGAEGMESKDTLTVYGGDFNIEATDDGINAANSLTLAGGNFYIVSYNNDGVDCNGELNLTGANIVSLTSSGAEGPFDVDNTPFVISGGDILGIGNSLTLPTQTSQNVIAANPGVSNITSVALTQNGVEVVSFEGLSGGSGSLLISSSKLQTGSTYTLVVNGTEVADVTVTEGVTTVGQVSTGPGGMGGQNFGGQGGPGGRR